MEKIIEVNENIIKGSLIYNLKNKFGNNYTYYDEVIEEGFKKPSFHVHRISNINIKGYTGNNYKLKNDSYRYVIKYFPNEAHTKVKDINNKLDELKELFEYLDIINIIETEVTDKEGKKVIVKETYSKPNRINNITATTSEGVLLFEMEFDIRTVKYNETDKVLTNTLKVGSNI